VIGATLATWRQRCTDLDLHGVAYADQLLAEADRVEQRARLDLQLANRRAAYVRARPAKYADAAYGMLRGDQDPQGLVSSWWEHGPRTLVIAGPQRTGKTTAAYAIGNHVHTLGWVMATTATGLSRSLKPEGSPLAYSYATRCDLLILDDLGRERPTEWWLEQLQDVVDERCSHNRRLIVTTNAEPNAQSAYEALAERYGDPVVERLIDGGGIVVVDGPAIRHIVTSW
jgi:DNA replication protein DnaC